MASSFEKVMEACLESKKATKGTAKKVTEQKKVTGKKTVSKKAQLESVKKVNRTPKSLRESEDEEFDVNVDEVEVDEYDDTMDDIADDIMVVIDPEIDAQDIDTVADELQDIIDNTPDDEVPTTDEYVGDDTYACPICGSTFFSEVEMHDGDECPVCGGTPEAFVAVGVVAPADEEVADEEEVVDIDVDEIPTDDGELEIVDVDEYEDDEEFESMRRMAMRRNAVKRESNLKRTRKPVARRPMRNESVRKPANRNAVRKPAQRKASPYQLDESTFNPFMTKFIRENYKNARSFAIKSATHFRNTHTLKIECVITMKNGNKKSATLKVENFNPNSRVMSAKDASRTFKCEGKVAPFRFSVRKVGNVIKCEGLRYNFVTKKVNESARHRVYGNYIKESAKRTPPVRKPTPKKDGCGAKARKRSK